jgi:hypothetical protein
MREETLSKLNSIIDLNSKALVGVLLKRLESLALPPDQSLNINQVKNIYAQLLKDGVYESSRNLKKIIKITFERGTIIFDSHP